MPSELTPELMAAVKAMIDNALFNNTQRVVVVQNVGGLVQIRRTGQADPDPQAYRKVDDLTVNPGDEVILQRVRSGWIVMPLEGSLGGGGGGDVATDAIWDQKGDLAVGLANDSAARLGVGSNGDVLTVDSAQTEGIKWAPPAPSGDVATDVIWDAPGDLAVGTGADTAVRVPVGGDGEVLVADSGVAAGVKWEALIGTSPYWEVIYDVTLASSDDEFILSSIDDKYRMFRLTFYGLKDGNAGTVAITLNGDTGNNYSLQRSTVSDTTTTSSRQSNRANFVPVWGADPAANAVAGFTATIEKMVTGKHALFQSHAVSFVSDAIVSILTTGRWQNTADLITSIRVFSGTGDFIAGTRLVIEAIDPDSSGPGHPDLAAHEALGLAPADYPYLGFGSDATLSAEVDVRGLSFVNEVMNFPSLEEADDTQPEWWEEADANCTLTEVDLAGEGITEKYERALKIVVASANSYAYQRYTYANQPRLKAGRPVSVLLDVWSVSGVAVRGRLQSSVGSLGVSADTTAAAWTQLWVEGVTLDGTTVELRLEVDVGTAYVVPLALMMGGRAVALPPRPLKRRQLSAPPSILDTTAQQNSFADLDISAAAGPLAVVAEVCVRGTRTAAGTSHTHVRTNWSSAGPDDSTRVLLYGPTPTNADVYSWYTIMLSDTGIFERRTEGGTISEKHRLHAVWEWA